MAISDRWPLVRGRSNALILLIVVAAKIYGLIHVIREGGLC